METTEESGQRPVRTGAAMTMRERIAALVADMTPPTASHWAGPEATADAILALLQSDEAVERCAEAIDRADYVGAHPDENFPRPWSSLNNFSREHYRKVARAAIAALLGDAP